MTQLRNVTLIAVAAVLAALTLVTPAQAQGRGTGRPAAAACDTSQIRLRMLTVTGTTKVAGDTQAVNLVFSGPITSNDVAAIRFDRLENASVGFNKASDYQGTGVVFPYAQNRERPIFFLHQRLVNERSTVYFTIFHKCGEFHSFYSRPKS